jgi:hypothetical protein
MQNILLSLVCFVILILPFAIYDIRNHIYELIDSKNHIKDITDEIKNMSSEDIKKEEEMNNSIIKLHLLNVDKISNKTIREYERKNLSKAYGIRNIDRLFRLHERKNRAVKSVFVSVFFTGILFVFLYMFWFQYELLVSLFKLSLNYYKEIIVFFGVCFILVFLFVKNLRSKIVTYIKQDIRNILHSLKFLTTKMTEEDIEREETKGLLFYTFVSLVLFSLVSGMVVIKSNWFMYSCFIVGLGLLFWLGKKLDR